MKGNIIVEMGEQAIQDQHRDGYQSTYGYELRNGISPASQWCADSRLNCAIVGCGFLSRAAVMVPALRNALAIVQRRCVAQLRTVLHGRVDIQDAGFSDKRVGPDVDRPGLNEVRLCPVTGNDRVFA